ncbi:MAG: hypothetical protein ACE5LU_29425, partial [Anaerolineae bacterium]
PEVLSRLRAELVGLRPRYPPAVNLAAADLDDQPGEELAVAIGHRGLRAWVFRRTPAGHQALPLPSITPWPMSDAVPALQRVDDLTGDGHTEVLVEYTTLGGTATILEPIIARWNGQGFDILFIARVSQWTTPRTEWSLVARDDGPGFDVELVYPVFGVHDHKLLDHPRGRQRWRWNPNVGRYVLLSESVEEPFTLRHLVNLAEARFLAGDFASALPLYRRVLTDTTLALAPGVGMPAEAEPDWRGYAHFRLGETYALLSDEAAARRELALAQQACPELCRRAGGTIARLADAFLSHYTGDASLPAALAAPWDVPIYDRSQPHGGNLAAEVNRLAVWSPGAAITVFLNRYPEVLSSGSYGTVTALRAADVSVASGLVADLDGDESPEFAFITRHKLWDGTTYHYAWLAWQDPECWRVRQIEMGRHLALMGIEASPTGRGLVLLIEKSSNAASHLGRWLWDGRCLGWVDQRTGEARWPSPWPRVGGVPRWEGSNCSSLHEVGSIE